jgi:hypothetical protein
MYCSTYGTEPGARETQYGCIIHTEQNQVIFLNEALERCTINCTMTDLPHKNVRKVGKISEVSYYLQTAVATYPDKFSCVFYSDNDSNVSVEGKDEKRIVLFNPQNYRLLKTLLNRARKEELAKVIGEQDEKLDYLTPLIPQISYFGRKKHSILTDSITTFVDDHETTKKAIVRTYRAKIGLQVACFILCLYPIICTRLYGANMRNSLLLTLIPFSGLVLVSI